MMLVRHGETAANLEQRYHGRRDSPLTERGIAQAHGIGRRLNTLLDASAVEIISSPQARAHRTAEIIRECFGGNLSPVRLDDRLCEVSIGGWEGLSQAEIIALAPGTFEGDGRHNWCFGAPNGETYAEFEARLAGWLSEISDHPALIIVTHGIVTRSPAWPLYRAPALPHALAAHTTRSSVLPGRGQDRENRCQGRPHYASYQTGLCTAQMPLTRRV